MSYLITDMGPGSVMEPSATRLVAEVNAAAGIERWWMLPSPGHVSDIRDLGDSLLEQMSGDLATRRIVLLGSGLGAACHERRDSVVTVSRDDAGRVLVHVDRSEHGCWSSLVEAGLLPEVLTADGFERLVRGLREHAGENGRWIGVWCFSFEELLARLDLVESIGEDGVPQQDEPLRLAEPGSPELVRLGNEVVLMKYASMSIWGEEYEAVVAARPAGGKIMVHKTITTSHDNGRQPPSIDVCSAERPLSVAEAWAWAEMDVRSAASEAAVVLLRSELSWIEVEDLVLSAGAGCSSDAL